MAKPSYECHGTDRRRVVSMTIFTVVCVVLAVMGIVIFFTGFTGWGMPDVIMLVIILVLLVYAVFGISIITTAGKTYVRVYFDHVEARGYGLRFRPRNGGVIGGNEINVTYDHIDDVTVRKSMVTLYVDGKPSQVPCPNEDAAANVATAIGMHLRRRKR